jgi:hypothetical protein
MMALKRLQSRAIPALARALCALTLALTVVGCAKEPPVERIIAVPSSKPYRFITFSKTDHPDTVAQIDRHNETHARMKAAEKAAKPK